MVDESSKRFSNKLSRVDESPKRLSSKLSVVDESPKRWIGIDIGTSYIRAFIWDPKTDEITELDRGSQIPALIYKSMDGIVKIGESAMAHDCYVRNALPFLGKTHNSEDC